MLAPSHRRSNGGGIDVHGTILGRKQVTDRMDGGRNPKTNGCLWFHVAMIWREILQIWREMTTYGRRCGCSMLMLTLPLPTDDDGRHASTTLPPARLGGANTFHTSQRSNSSSWVLRCIHIGLFHAFNAISRIHHPSSVVDAILQLLFDNTHIPLCKEEGKHAQSQSQLLQQKIWWTTTTGKGIRQRGTFRCCNASIHVHVGGFDEDTTR